MRYKLLILMLFIFPKAWADRTETFSGIAKENGKIVYTENHKVRFNDKGEVLDATTTYVSPSGKTLGVLKSDFRISLSLPEHIFVDERTKGQYGIRRSENNIVLFNQDAGKKEQQIELPDKKDQERIQVGCQGFNYFLKGKLDNLKT